MDTVALEMGDPAPGDEVLIVEDEVLIRLHLADGLRAAGLIVREAANAADAQRLIGTFRAIKLVITDIRMPGEIDGIGLARWIRATRSEVKIIIVSANVGLEPPVEADLAFAKPLDTEAIIAAVRRLMPRREQW